MNFSLTFWGKNVNVVEPLVVANGVFFGPTQYFSQYFSDTSEILVTLPSISSALVLYLDFAFRRALCPQLKPWKAE